MNSNTFQDNPATTRDGAITYKFGSLANADPDGAGSGGGAQSQCDRPRGASRSRALTVWLADGINHPGQADHRTQFERVAEGLQQVHAHLPDDWRMYTEHKPYEPAFYATVNNDWGSSLPAGAGGR